MKINEFYILFSSIRYLNDESTGRYLLVLCQRQQHHPMIDETSVESFSEEHPFVVELLVEEAIHRVMNVDDQNEWVEQDEDIQQRRQDKEVELMVDQKNNCMNS